MSTTTKKHAARDKYLAKMIGALNANIAAKKATTKGKPGNVVQLRPPARAPRPKVYTDIEASAALARAMNGVSGATAPKKRKATAAKKADTPVQPTSPDPQGELF